MNLSFRLQTLLNWKKGLEEQSRIILARKIEELKKKEEEIQKLIYKRLNYYQELNKKLKEGIQSEEYIIYQNFDMQSYEDLVVQKAYKNDKENEVEEERRKLVNLIKERKILERLKEKKLRKMIYQQEKNEQKLIDEVTIFKKNFK
jgi:flagellar FliJ protein